MDDHRGRFSVVFLAIMLTGTAQLAAQDCPNVEWRSPTPFGYSLNDVVFSNGVFLAPAGNSHVAISSDGESWTLHRVTAAETGLWRAYWNGSVFVVGASSGQVFTSPNGIDWTWHNVTGAFATIIGVATKGSTTVVGDFEGVLAITTDWQSWSVVHYAPERIYALAASDSEFIAVGDFTMILRSTNGVNWTDVSPSLPSGVTLHDVIWNGSQFLAVGVGGHTFRSPDGLVWEESSLTHSVALYSAAWDGTRFVVQGRYPERIYSSLNGASWTFEAELDEEVRPTAIEYGAGRYVVVGERGANLSSTDRSTWIPHYSGPYDHLYGVTSNRARLVAVGDSGVTLSSATGAAWSPHPLPQSIDLRGVTWSGTEFLAVGELGAVWASVSGETWSERSTGSVTATLYEIAAGADLVVVGETGTILTSADGVSWTPVDSTVAADLHAVTSNGSLIVAVGDSGTIVTSPNATTWTERTSGTTRDLRTILWDGSNFWATGHNGDLVVSSDGITWVDGDPITSPNGTTTHDLQLYHGTYVAANRSNGIMLSSDMTTWTADSEWNWYHAIGPSSTGAVAVGLHGSIIGLECWGIIFSDGFETGDTSNWSTSVLE